MTTGQVVNPGEYACTGQCLHTPDGLCVLLHELDSLLSSFVMLFSLDVLG